MKNGLAGRLADRLSPFGPPTRFIYKGARSENNLRWRDYLIEFGPGSQLKFSIGLDEAAKIASISYGQTNLALDAPKAIQAVHIDLEYIAI